METIRCWLNKLQAIDYENVRELYINEEVRNYLGGTINDEEVLRAKFYGMLESSATDSHYWVIRAKINNDFIGLISLSKHHDGINMEVSYQLLPNWWGNGYGTEVVERVLLFAFKELDLSKVIAETQTANKSSCRMLEKVGMKLKQTIQRYNEEQAIYCISKQY